MNIILPSNGIHSPYREVDLFEEEKSQCIYFPKISHQEINCEEIGTPQKQFQQNHSVQNTNSQTTVEVILKCPEKLNSKNQPKQIGNNFSIYIKDKKIVKKNQPSEIKEFMHARSQQKQSKCTIKQIQKLCKDEESRKIFLDFIQNEQLLYLLHSNKVNEPLSSVLSISNYYAAGLCPDKMKGNSQVERNIIE